MVESRALALAGLVAGALGAFSVNALAAYADTSYFRIARLDAAPGAEGSYRVYALDYALPNPAGCAKSDFAEILVQLPQPALERAEVQTTLEFCRLGRLLLMRRGWPAYNRMISEWVADRADYERVCNTAKHDVAALSAAFWW